MLKAKLDFHYPIVHAEFKHKFNIEPDTLVVNFETLKTLLGDKIAPVVYKGVRAYHDGMSNNFHIRLINKQHACRHTYREGLHNVRSSI